MSTEKNNLSETPSDREIVLSRVFDAPRELVWDAFTDPKKVVNWWGPTGFTMTIEEMDLRPGGVWTHVMHGPDGTDYPNKSVFKEITKPERIVFSNGGGKKGGHGVSFEMTWTFDVVEGDKTRLTIHQVYASKEDRDTVIKVYGAIEGGKQCLARLGEQLDSDRDSVISRVFDAPRELVWKAWTDPKHMTQWWGPHGFTNPVCELDVRVGGAYRTVLRSPDGVEYPCAGIFREIVEPERLVMTMDCSDHPDSWHDLVNPNRDKTKKPVLDCVQTVTFEKIGNKTKLTIRTRFESVEIRNAMLKVGMNEGWSASLERLAECVSRF